MTSSNAGEPRATCFTSAVNAGFRLSRARSSPYLCTPRGQSWLMNKSGVRVLLRPVWAARWGVKYKSLSMSY